MIGAILSVEFYRVFGFALFIIVYGWMLLLPFIGLFHLCFWTYRWFNRAGTPRLYVKRLKIYISLVLLYGMGALLIYILQQVDSTPYRFVNVWTVYLTLVPTFFPFYYWFGIFRYSRKLNF